MHPFIFKENRVWRVYSGGRQIDCLRKKTNPVDCLLPEEWIASTVKANNPQRNYPGEGISTAIIDGKEVDFTELLKAYPEEMLGAEHLIKHGITLVFLSKLLDSAIRLPIQAHPDNKVAKELYNSNFGKTEAWIVLETREIEGEKPYLMLGFNEQLDKDVFIEEAMTGTMPQSLQMIHKHEVKAGDIIMLQGGLIHAIGPGVFMIEIMEPTDLVVQPELYCGEQMLSTGDRFGAIAPDKALQVFDYTPQTAESVWQKCSVDPKVIEDNDKYQLSILLDRKQIILFGAEKIVVKISFSLYNTESICRVGIVCKGNLSVTAADKTLNLKQGDSLFIPASAGRCDFKGQGEVIFTLPPM